MAFRRASARVPQRQLGKGAGGMLLFPLLAETSPKSKPQPALLESSFPSPPAAGTAGATRPSPGSVRGPEPPPPPDPFPAAAAAAAAVRSSVGNWGGRGEHVRRRAPPPWAGPAGGAGGLRAGAVGGAGGAGMAHGHGRCCCCCGEAAAAVGGDGGAAWGLYLRIDRQRLQCLNERREGSGALVFRAWEERGDRTQVGHGPGVCSEAGRRREGVRD